MIQFGDLSVRFTDVCFLRQKKPDMFVKIFIMKKENIYPKSIFILSLFALCITATAQETANPVKETILNTKVKARLVSNVELTATRVDKSTALMFKPSIGVLINERIYAGFSTNLTLNERFLKDASYNPIKDETSHWEFNYTGLELGYIFSATKSISPGIGLYTGWGKAERKFTWNSLSKQSPEWALVDKSLCRKGYFFFAEPSLALNFNLSQSVSVKANTGYRFVYLNNTVSAMQMPGRKFNGPSVAVTVMFSDIFKGGR